jgi:CBS domain-containing protein
MNVSSVMTRDPVCCTPDASLIEVAQLMVDNNCGEIPIVDRDLQPVGVITDRDITCRTVAKGKNPLELTAADCMTSPCLTITPDTDLSECCQLLQTHQLRRILVVDDDGCVCGIVAQADIAKHAPARETAEVVREVSNVA